MRRWLVWCLAGLWLVAAGLQLQPAMLNSAFNINILYPAALMYQPPPVKAFLLWVVHLMAPYPDVISPVAAAVQALIAIGILWPRTRRAALIGSVVWALLVWVCGEGFGFLPTGTALVEFGAPGAALMLAAAALVLLPTARGSGSCAAALGALGERGTKLLWSALWLLAVGLHFQPPFSTGAVLAYNMQSAAQEQLGGLAGVDYRLATWAFAHSLLVSGLLAALELGLALAVWSPRWRNLSLVVASLLTGLFWVFCQALGGLLIGQATDLNLAPVVLVLAASLWRLDQPSPARDRPALNRPVRRVPALERPH